MLSKRLTVRSVPAAAIPDAVLALAFGRGGPRCLHDPPRCPERRPVEIRFR